MGILALDCSQPQGCLAFTTSTDFHTWTFTDASASGILAEVLQTHQPTSLILGIGPGRLSGLRSSASFMAGLSRALSIPIYTISSLLIAATHAHQQHKESTIQVVIDARLGQYFVARYTFIHNSIYCLQEAHLVSSFTHDVFTVGILPPADADRIDVMLTNIVFPDMLQLGDVWSTNEQLHLSDPNAIALCYVRSAV